METNCTPDLDTATEHRRVAELRSLGILDTDREPEFDQIIELAAAICGTPISSCTLVDAERQWFKASKGVDVRETERELSFCSHAIKQDHLMVVGDTTKDERFLNHPWVTGEAGIRFYAGMPLPSPSGLKLGTLCVADTVPRNLTDVQKSALEVLTAQLKVRIELAAEKRRLQNAFLETNRLLKALETSNDRFQRFMNNGPFLSYIRDEQGRFVFYSAHVAARFHVDSTAWLGKSLADLFPAEAAAEYLKSDSDALRSRDVIIALEESRDEAGVVTFWRSFKFSYPNEEGRPMLGGVSVDITEEVLAKQELERKSELLTAFASTDALTGLANRRVFDERLQAAVRSAAEQNHPLSLILLDIDNFKRRNDTFGHQAGDDVLRRLGSIIGRTIRGSDVAARYGGEEIVVLLPATSEANAVLTAERLRRKIAAEPWLHGPVTASFGVAALHSGNSDAQELVARADRAMYQAKRNGKDRVAVG